MESKIPAVEVKLGFKWQGLLIAVIVGLGIWLIPTPEGLSAKAWGMLALLWQPLWLLSRKQCLWVLQPWWHW